MRSKSSRVSTVRRNSAYRPRIESLEDRRLMAVITVTGTGDAINATDGVVTLREAITAANSHKNISDVVGVGAYGTDDTIAFDIPGPGVHTIAPTSPLPVITDPMTIDGYTQPGSAPNTNPVGRGSTALCSSRSTARMPAMSRFGLIQIETHDSTVRGLVINRAQGVKLSLGNSLVTNGNNLSRAATSAPMPPAPRPSPPPRTSTSTPATGSPSFRLATPSAERRRPPAT